jgi:hypothetical protein
VLPVHEDHRTGTHTQAHVAKDTLEKAVCAGESLALLLHSVIEYLVCKILPGHKVRRLFSQALAQLDDHLQYWPKFLVHKNKQRLTKITQYLIHMRKLALKNRPKLVTMPARCVPSVPDDPSHVLGL